MDYRASVQTPEYDHLRADGDALRIRLALLGLAVDGLEAFIDDLRAWQRRSTWAVVSRNPHQAAEFHNAGGPFQPPLRAWTPMPGWQQHVDESIVAWLDALDSLARSSSRAPAAERFADQRAS